MAVEWYYQEQGQTLGPISSEQMRNLATQGVLTPWTPIRRVSGSDQSPWKVAGKVKGLFVEDVSDQLGNPICEDCGSVLDVDGCPKCRPIPPPIQTEVASSIRRATATFRIRTASIGVEKRSPNLVKYLDWMQRLARILLFVTWAILGFCVIFVKVISEYPVADLLIASFAALIAYVWYVCSIAGLEFIQVVIDIEENTRDIKENTRNIEKNTRDLDAESQ